MSNKIRRSTAQWQDILARYARSGQTQQAFCREHDLALSTFCKWRRTLGVADAQPVFAQIEVDQEPPGKRESWDVELALGSGVVLRIRAAGC